MGKRIIKGETVGILVRMIYSMVFNLFWIISTFFSHIEIRKNELKKRQRLTIYRPMNILIQILYNYTPFSMKRKNYSIIYYQANKQPMK